jgi:hypothetical protein
LNDDINLAVPEGTPVKAAEDAVVSYAGSGLAGDGNLVLIRHFPQELTMNSRFQGKSNNQVEHKSYLSSPACY